MAWFYAMLLCCNFTLGVKNSHVRKQLGLGHKSTHRLCNQIRLQMAARCSVNRLGGEGKLVHIDEVHVKYIRNESTRSASTAIVLGLACEGHIRAGIVVNRRRATLLAEIERMVIPGSTIVTDRHQSYHCLSKLGWDHIKIDHSRAFHNFHGVTNNPIESYWALLKRNLRSYRQVGEENLWLFLAEIQFKNEARKRGGSPFNHLIQSFPDISVDPLNSIRRQFDWR